MRETWSFWRDCIRRAREGTSAFANDWQWVFGVPAVSAIGVYVASNKGATALTTDYPVLDAFVAALVAFLITWFVAFVIRMYKSAPAMFQEQKERGDNLEARLSPKIDICLDPHTAGMTVTQSGMFPVKYIQILVRPATDGDLIECEVLLHEVARIDGKTRTVVYSQPLNAGWSGLPERAVPIQNGQKRAANLFSVSKEDDILRPQTLHPDSGLAIAVRKPGVYQLAVVASAKNSAPKKRSFVLQWGGSFSPVAIQAADDSESN
jgi:hypothetical protein